MIWWDYDELIRSVLSNCDAGNGFYIGWWLWDNISEFELFAGFFTYLLNPNFLTVSKYSYSESINKPGVRKIVPLNEVIKNCFRTVAGIPFLQDFSHTTDAAFIIDD